MNKALVVALFAAAALSACSSTKSKEARLKNPAPCPNIIVLQDAARLVEFAGEQTIENVAYSAEIETVSLQCRYVGARPIDASVKVSLAFGEGPAAAEKSKTFGYFVAVTRKDVEVIAKEEFFIPVRFDGSRTVRRVEEKVDTIRIPRANENVAGGNFEVIVGLVLTPEQAIYNRSGKSLKFPELK